MHLLMCVLFKTRMYRQFIEKNPLVARFYFYIFQQNQQNVYTRHKFAFTYKGGFDGIRTQNNNTERKKREKQANDEKNE